ncbi:MAG: hypothetical protein V1910_00605 [bacterium]
MSKWFLIVLIIIFLSSIIVILIRNQNKKEIERLEKKDNFSADDFEIIE